VRARIHHRAALGLALVVAAELAAGCGSASTHGGHPVVLVVETADARGPDHTPGIRQFVERLQKFSGGSVRVNVRIQTSPHVPDTARDYPETERELVRRVAAGRSDLGWVGTHVFSSLGVHALDALDAPMLIDGYPLEAAVLRSGMASRMLAGVRRLGVVGLSVLAGPLARPADINRPLVAPEQYRGLRWRVLPSAVRDDAARSVGASPTHELHPFYVLAIDLRLRKVGALEADLDSLFFQLVSQIKTAYATSNVVLWPNTAALIANPQRLRELTSEQRRWLREAAAGAAADSIGAADVDAAAMRDLCATGVRFATASPAQVAGLRRAFAPVTARLQRDPATRAYLRRIQTLKSRMAAPPALAAPPTCRADHPAPLGAGPPVRSTLPDGVYRTRITKADLRQIGERAPDLERGAGTMTLRLGGGRFTLEHDTALERVEESGVYFGSPERTAFAVVRVDGKPLPFVNQIRVSIRYEEGALAIVPVEDADDQEALMFGAHPWKRVG
jgi:TRAP-type C4-dicarboxylate transport system substrate-binding protein